MVHNNVWGCISTSRYLQRPWSADQLLICYFSISYYYINSVHRDAPTGIIRIIPLHSELPLTWLVTLFLVHKLYTYSNEYIPCWQILTYRYQVRTYPKLGILCHLERRMTYANQVSPGYSDEWSISMYGAVSMASTAAVCFSWNCFVCLLFSISYCELFCMHQHAPTGIICIIPIHSELPPYL